MAVCFTADSVESKENDARRVSPGESEDGVQAAGDASLHGLPTRADHPVFRRNDIAPVRFRKRRFAALVAIDHIC